MHKPVTYHLHCSVRLRFHMSGMTACTRALVECWTLQCRISLFDRMDEGTNVDLSNVVRADDKPNIEAELPTPGTSSSLKEKFQSMDGGLAKPIDYSKPVKREKHSAEQQVYVALLYVISSLMCLCFDMVLVSMWNVLYDSNGRQILIVNLSWLRADRWLMNM